MPSLNCDWANTGERARSRAGRKLIAAGTRCLGPGGGIVLSCAHGRFRRPRPCRFDDAERGAGGFSARFSNCWPAWRDARCRGRRSRPQPRGGSVLGISATKDHGGRRQDRQRSAWVCRAGNDQFALRRRGGGTAPNAYGRGAIESIRPKRCGRMVDEWRGSLVVTQAWPGATHLAPPLAMGDASAGTRDLHAGSAHTGSNVSRFVVACTAPNPGVLRHWWIAQARNVRSPRWPTCSTPR